MKILTSLLVAAVASLNLACASTAYGTGGYDRHDDRYRYDTAYRDDSIARAAHDLDLAADQFYADLRYAMGNRHTAKDARNFAREARRFHRSIERDRRGHRIIRDFRELEREFHQVHDLFGGHDRRGWGRYGSRRGHGDFQRVEAAFIRLQRAVDRSFRHGHDGRYGRHDDRYRDRHGASLTLRLPSD